MEQLVYQGAICNCSFGLSPAPLTKANTGGPHSGPVGFTIMDNTPMTCILPFAMCTTPGNPDVAAAFVASGVLTPMPCIPVPRAPWFPGSRTTLIDGIPALTASSICMCKWGGVICISDPGRAPSAS